MHYKLWWQILGTPDVPTYLKNLGKGCNTDFRNSDRNRKTIDLTFSYVITCALKHTTTKMYHLIELLLVHKIKYLTGLTF
jgi:hypothetical protein